MSRTMLLSALLCCSRPLKRPSWSVRLNPISPWRRPRLLAPRSFRWGMSSWIRCTHRQPLTSVVLHLDVRCCVYPRCCARALDTEGSEIDIIIRLPSCQQLCFLFLLHQRAEPAFDIITVMESPDMIFKACL